MFRRSSRPACSGVIRVDQVLAKPKKGRATRRWPLLNPLISFRNLKRAKGFEPLTPTLARLLCGGPKQQVMMGAPSRNHLYRRRSQVMIDAGPRNHLYLLGAQVKIRSCPRNQILSYKHSSTQTLRITPKRSSPPRVASQPHASFIQPRATVNCSPCARSSMPPRPGEAARQMIPNKRIAKAHR